MYRSSNYSRSSKAETQAPKPTKTESNDVDPFILDFGTSVSVNEDQRRMIRVEIQELDDKIELSTNANKQEEGIQVQLKKDLSHSHSEIKKLARGSLEQSETSGVHSDLLGGLERSLDIELAGPAGIKDDVGGITGGGTSSSPHTVSGDGDIPHSTEGESNNKKVRQSHQDQLAEAYANMTKSFAALKQISESIDSNLLRKRIATTDTDAIYKTIEDEKLHSILAEKRDEATKQEEEGQKERNRKHSLKSSTQQSRTQSAALAQDVANKTRVLNSFQRESYLELVQLFDTVSATQRQIEQHRKQFAERKLEYEAKQLRLDACKTLQSQIKQHEETYTEKLEELRQLQSDNAKLTHVAKKEQYRAKEMTENLERIQSKLNIAVSENLEASKLAEMNNEEEKSILIPGREELKRLEKTKERLVLEIGKIHEESKAEATEQAKELKEKLETKTACTEKLESLKKELQGAVRKRKTFEMTRQEYRSTFEREIEELEKVAEKYRLALESEKTNEDEQQQSQEAERAEKLSIKQAELDRLRASNERRLQMYQCAAKILEEKQSTILSLRQGL